MNEYFVKIIDDVVPDTNMVDEFLSLEDTDMGDSKDELIKHFNNISLWVDTYAIGVKAKSLEDRTNKVIAQLDGMESLPFDRNICLANGWLDDLLLDTINEIGATFEDEDVSRLYHVTKIDGKCANELVTMNIGMVVHVLKNRKAVIDKVLKLKNTILDNLEKLSSEEQIKLIRLGYSIKTIFVFYVESVLRVESLLKSIEEES